MSHPHVFRVTRVTHFVARWGIEPQTIHLKGERFNHCATDLARQEGRNERKKVGKKEEKKGMKESLETKPGKKCGKEKIGGKER